MKSGEWEFLGGFIPAEQYSETCVIRTDSQYNPVGYLLQLGSPQMRRYVPTGLPLWPVGDMYDPVMFASSQACGRTSTAADRHV
jgi:hypothetical protein